MAAEIATQTMPPVGVANRSQIRELVESLTDKPETNAGYYVMIAVPHNPANARHGIWA